MRNKFETTEQQLARAEAASWRKISRPRKDRYGDKPINLDVLRKVRRAWRKRHPDYELPEDKELIHKALSHYRQTLESDTKVIANLEILVAEDRQQQQNKQH